MRKEVQSFLSVGNIGRQFDLCLQSLAKYLPPGSQVFVFGQTDSEVEVRESPAVLEGSLDLKYARPQKVMGPAATLNWALREFWAVGNDLLLLNDQTEVTLGFLEEMQSVLHLNERHAIVTPRSNNAGLFSLPANEILEPHESWEVWLKIRDLLPRYQLVPAVGSFCMLIKSEVLERFGLFDPACSSPGYENDFRGRINRYGYSSLTANRAYVLNHQPSSDENEIGESETGQPSLLRERYPELDRAISNYARFQVDPLEKFAILYSSHRPRILFDLYHLPPQHSGTSDFALNLLREIGPLISQDFELFVGAGMEQTFFLPELRGYQLHDEEVDSPAVFDLVYKPCQLFGWPEFARMNRLAPRLAFTLQDIIAIRCDYIGRTGLPELFFKTVELSDLVFSISESTHADFEAFYSAQAPMRVINHGSDAGLHNQGVGHGEYLLVMGNAYVHKGVSDAVQELAGRWPLVVLGLDPQSSQPDVRWLPSGKLTRRCVYDLFLGARIVVYPSHYECFGLPVVDALAMGKPVIVLDTAINRELSHSTGDRNLFRVASSKDLPRTVEDLWSKPPHPPPSHPRRWSDVAGDYFAAFQQMLSADIDVTKMRRRWEVVRLLESTGLH